MAYGLKILFCRHGRLMSGDFLVGPVKIPRLLDRMCWLIKEMHFIYCTLFFVTFWGKNNTELNSVLKTGFYARVGHFLIRILQIWIYTIIIILRTVQNGPVRSSHRERPAEKNGEFYQILGLALANILKTTCTCSGHFQSWDKLDSPIIQQLDVHVFVNISKLVSTFFDF